MKRITTLPGLTAVTQNDRLIELSVVTTAQILHADDPPRSPFKPFRAISFLLIYCTGDEGFHHIDFVRYPCKKGTLLMISKDQIHFFDPHLPVEGNLIVFTEKFLLQSCGPEIQPGFFSLFQHHLYPPAIQLDRKKDARVSSFVYQLKETFDAPDGLFREQMLEAILKLLLYSIEQILRTDRKNLESLYYRQDFSRFLTLLETHILENRQVSFYADEMAISTKKLNRITQEIVHLPAKNYINELFLLKTCRLLVNRSLSVKEIAYRTGFDAPTNFVKFFKTHTGKTPAEFRRQY